MSAAPLIVVTGTGTEIGKTHFACGLVGEWASRGLRIAGVKPVESGVPPGNVGPDAAALGRMSTFHVTRSLPPYMLTRAVSPHLAAREARVAIDIDVVLAWLAPIRDAADGVVVELPGGLYSPLSSSATNADLARALAPTATLLVAPDRLGVLHDVGAATRAARAGGLAIDGLVLAAPASSDPSTRTNAGELPLVTDVPVLAELPRAAVDDPSFRSACRAVLTRLSLRTTR